MMGQEVEQQNHLFLLLLSMVLTRCLVAAIGSKYQVEESHAQLKSLRSLFLTGHLLGLQRVLLVVSMLDQD